ncbi:MAG: hypothetical protein AAF999_16205 [Pseudomonadota bacterium]
MLEILGTIGGNILSLPGILGLALGMMTRNVLLAGIMGGVVGVAETLIFAKMSFANVEPIELVVAIIVGIFAGCVGCAIRRKGTTV